MAIVIIGQSGVGCARQVQKFPHCEQTNPSLPVRYFLEKINRKVSMSLETPPASADTIETNRLMLRALCSIDVDSLQVLLQERDIASMTRAIPHPYPPGAAEKWLEEQLVAERVGDAWVRVVTRKSDEPISQDVRPLIGVVGLAICQENQNAELGYWLGKPYWGQGYCTEAAQAVVQFGFQELGLFRIHAHHFARNEASGRVLSKLGMSREGCLRKHVRKWGRFEDVIMYGMLATD